MNLDLRNSCVSENTLGDLYRKYAEVESLIGGLFNPCNSEHLKARYKAIKILQDIRNQIEEILDQINKSDPAFLSLEIFLGSILLTMGTISIETDEWSFGEKYLMECLNLLEENALEPRNVLTVIGVCNQLGILWSDKGDVDKSFKYLSQSEKLYNDYKELVNEPPVECLGDLFSSKELPKNKTQIEKLHTLTLYYLAQVYRVMGNPNKSASYCHITLKRQLNQDDNDLIDWALNSATLAQIFLEKRAFKLSRHHLAASSYMLDKYQASVSETNAKMNEEESENFKEWFYKRSADIARCWFQYGSTLLEVSQERLIKDSDKEDTDNPVAPTHEEINDLYPEFKDLFFTGLDLGSYENQVTSDYALIYDDAKPIFQNAQMWMNKATEYYSIDNHASDYVDLIQEMSNLYKHLAFFEDDDHKRAKLHKKRIKILEKTVSSIQPKYYKTACQEIWYSLGDIYSYILDLYFGKVEEDPNPQQLETLKKINFYNLKAIIAYKHFLDLFKDERTNTFPKEIHPNFEHSVLKTNIYIARLYGKLVSFDNKVKFENTKKSLEYYQAVLDYCKTNERAKEVIGAEQYSICSEMVKLLPLKMEKLLSGTVAH